VAVPGRIVLGRVVHGYRDLFFKTTRDFGDSGNCNINVNCPDGDAWANEVRAVAMILTGGGSRICTGTLVNNVRQDRTPLFLTANHCLGGEATWIIMFNYQSPNCNDIDGPTADTVQGTTRLANNSASDFALLRLQETPPPAYDVFWAGWSAVDTASPQSTCIHHPNGDIKKISFDHQPVVSSSYGGSPPDTRWKVLDWDKGTTEPGSSGSPLFDPAHRIVGQLHGGTAACGNDLPDYFGKFAVSWDYGSTAATRLKDWLDPDHTGTRELDGLGLISQAPVVKLTAPPAEAEVFGTILVECTATDTEGVAKVDFFADGDLIGSDAAAPYAAIWDTTPFPEGYCTLRAEATDVLGTVGFDQRRVRVRNGTLRCQVQAAPPAGLAPLPVTFTVTVTGGTPPYTYAWNWGDGGGSVREETTTHLYEIAGDYTWTLTVEDHDHHTTAATGNISVSLPPVVSVETRQAAHVTLLPGWSSRIHLVNRGQADHPVALLALDAAGRHAATAAIASLPPSAQLDADMAELFPGLDPATDFWVLVYSLSPLEGVTEFGTTDGQSLTTMPLFQSASRTLIFPYVYVSDLYYNGLTLINTENLPGILELDAYGEDGQLLDSAATAIAPLGKYVRLLQEIFDLADPNAVRFVKVRSDRLVSGFELFGSFFDAGLAGLPAAPGAAAAPAGAAAPVPAAAPPAPTMARAWGISSTEVHLRWEPVPEAGVTYNIFNNSGGFVSKVGTTTGNSFVLAGLRPGQTVSLTVKAVTAGGTSPATPAARAATLPEGETDFPHRLFYNELPTPDRNYTGVTFSNPGDVDGSIRAQLLDAAGQPLASLDWPAAPLAQITREIWAIAGTPPLAEAAYLKAGSARPILGFELYLTRSDLAEPFRFEGLPAVPWGYGHLVFPYVPAGAGWSCRLRLTNTVNLPGDLTIRAWNADGTSRGTHTATLPASAAADLDPAALFPGAGETFWLDVQSSVPLAGSLSSVSPDLARSGCYAGIPIEP